MRKSLITIITALAILGAAPAGSAHDGLAPNSSIRPQPNPFYEVRTDLAPSTSIRPRARPDNFVNGRCFIGQDEKEFCFGEDGKLLP